jgi:hypothetical protein
MVKNVAAKLLIIQELVHLVDVLPDFGDVERTEVLKEALVNQVLDNRQRTLSILKKKALGMSLGGAVSAR